MAAASRASPAADASAAAIITIAAERPTMRVADMLFSMVRLKPDSTYPRRPLLPLRPLQLDSSRTLPELLGWDPGLVEHREHQVRQRRVRLEFDVPIAL